MTEMASPNALRYVGLYIIQIGVKVGEGAHPLVPLVPPPPLATIARCPPTAPGGPSEAPGGPPGDPAALPGRAGPEEPRAYNGP